MGKALLYELGRSVSFANLSLKAKVLWPMLLAASDDQGRGLAGEDVVKWHICPNVMEIMPADVPGLLDEMEKQEMVALYQDDRGRSLYQVARWWDYQKMQWAQPSQYKAPEGWTDRVRANYRNREYTCENWDTGGGFGVPQSLSENPPVEPPTEPSGNPPENPPGNAPELTNKPNLTESKQTKTKDSPTAGAKPPKPTKNPTPEAVKVFRANAHRNPAKSWYADVAETVGEGPQDLERWGQVVKAYVGEGWNPTNVRGMLDFFERNEIPPGKGRQRGKSSHRTSTETVEIASGLGPPS